MLKLEVKEPSQSEWASPVVLIPKPDRSPWFCIDYRQLNERTVRDSYPLPRMDDCLDYLEDAQFFSTLECNAGYWQIPLAEEGKPKTAFICHCVTYQCTRLPFRLRNAPATFQRAIDMILSGFKWQKCARLLRRPHHLLHRCRVAPVPLGHGAHLTREARGHPQSTEELPLY